MSAKKPIHVRITGTGVNEEFDCISHEIVGLPAGTYHKFIFLNGVTALYNDFGIRCLYISTGSLPLNEDYPT